MGVLHISSEFTAFCIGKSIIIYNHRTSETRVLNDVMGTGGKQAGSEKNGDSGEMNIVTAKTSPDGQYFVVGCDTKVVVVWCTQTWKQLASHSLIKKPMALTITMDSSTLLVADKSGDVYEFPMLGVSLKKMDTEFPNRGSEGNGLDEPGGHEPLLGHLSMLLDVALTEDKKYVITCDRDEKIRVSHYPSAYDIHTFCLAHHEFVTQILLLSGTPHQLLSCSGDGTLRLWDYMKGECVCYVDTREQLQNHPDLHQHYLTHRTTSLHQQRASDSKINKHLAEEEKAEREEVEDKVERGKAEEEKKEEGERETTEREKTERERLKREKLVEEKAEREKVEGERADKHEDIRKTLPEYPAVKCMAVCSLGTGVHLVAALLDKIPAIFLYKINNQQHTLMTHLSTLTLSSEPHTAAWTDDAELVIVQNEVEERVRVFEFRDKVLESVSKHPLVELGKKYKDYFKGWSEPLDMDVLYKQRYDNVADYLRKKEERLANEKAAQDGLIPPVKRGRWVK